MNTLKYIFIIYFVLLFIDLNGASDLGPDQSGFSRGERLSRKVRALSQPWESQYFNERPSINLDRVAAIIATTDGEEKEGTGMPVQEGDTHSVVPADPPVSGVVGVAERAPKAFQTAAHVEADLLRESASLVKQKGSPSDGPPLEHSSSGNTKLAKPMGRGSISLARNPSGTYKGMSGLLSSSTVNLLDDLCEAEFDRNVRLISAKAPKRWFSRLFKRVR